MTMKSTPNQRLPVSERIAISPVAIADSLWRTTYGRVTFIVARMDRMVVVNNMACSAPIHNDAADCHMSPVLAGTN